MLSLNSLEALPFIHKLPLQSKEKNLLGIAVVFLVSFSISTLIAFTIIAKTQTKSTNELSPQSSSTPLPTTQYDSVSIQGFKEVSQLLLDQGQYYKAGSYLEKIISQDKNDTLAIRNMVTVLTHLQKKDEALLFLQKLNQLDPNNCQNIKLEINLLSSTEVLKRYNNHQYNNCLSHPGISNLIAQKILGVAPDESKTLLKANASNKSELYLLEAKEILNKEMAYSPKVEELLIKAKQEAPLHFESHFLLGKIYLMKKMNTLALKELEIAYRLSPENVAICYHLGLYYFKHSNQPDTAAKFFEKALSLNPSHWESALQMGLIFQKNGKTEGAIHYFKKSLEHVPHNTRILLQLGASYEKANKKKDAIKTYESILNIDNQNEIALYKIKILKKD